MSDEHEIVSIDLPLFDCEIDHKETFEDLLAETERLMSSGWRVLVANKIRFGANGEHDAYAIIERSTGGEGITKFYEIAIYCPIFQAQFEEHSRGNDLPSFHTVTVPYGYFGVRSCLNFCARILVERGYDPNPKAVGFWRDGENFEFAGDSVPNPFDVWSAIQYAREHWGQAPFDQKRHLGSFAFFLTKNFAEDSTENIIGRIFSKALDLFDAREGQTPVADRPNANEWVANGVFEIGQLYERLIWKVRYEASAAVGKRAEETQKIRTTASGATSMDLKILRIESLLLELEGLLEENPDIGMVGLKNLAQVAANKAKSKDPKLWSQGSGQVQSYLEYAKADPRFSEQFQRIKSKTA